MAENKDNTGAVWLVTDDSNRRCAFVSGRIIVGGNEGYVWILPRGKKPNTTKQVPDYEVFAKIGTNVYGSVLWKSKEGSKTFASGKIAINSVEYWINLVIPQTENENKPSFCVFFNPVEQQARQQKPQYDPPIDDSDVPF
jgi:hypothetical protein